MRPALQTFLWRSGARFRFKLFFAEDTRCLIQAQRFEVWLCFPCWTDRLSVSVLAPPAGALVRLDILRIQR